MAVRGSMTRSSIVAALVVGVLLGLLIWWRDEHGSVERDTDALRPQGAFGRPAGEVAAVSSARPVSSPAVPPMATGANAQRPGEPRPYERPALTEAMRERRRRVLDLPAARAPLPANPSPAAEAAPHAMQDRTGTSGAEVKALNEQLGPLVDQCFDQARERGVRQSGMLAVGVKLAGAEGIGRIIESLEPAPGNAIDDGELVDCVRQSAFTVDLPPPSSSGGSEFMLTIPFEGAPDASAASR